MFGLNDLISLVISAFIILPVVIFMRELGYVIMSAIFGVVNPRLTIGSGPRLFKFWIFDVRKYYHLYSWYSYDDLKRKGKFAYVLIYAGPILINLVPALILNALIANDIVTEYETFWNRFLFYQFYYVLFDIVPMKTINGMPNNGMIIYEMLRYGKRVDYNNEPFIPSTSEVEEEYRHEMEELEEQVEEMEEAAEDMKETSGNKGTRHEDDVDEKDREERTTGGW
ncbi:hypothetical protein AV656_11695 [Bhargavaea cecembensis]|uniref:Uncharacterized protein n=1 Tax=Bhargavaea cecembensis TaxID=394098 RepID=A0A161RCH5_9BACL|nr:hypothetical protein [Bhargavaea cecembensis]KZE37232.1 hypothetical protein AV656_11695 [Bhargavaea cecembensis]